MKHVLKTFLLYIFLLGLTLFLYQSFCQNPFNHYYWGDSAVYEYIGKSLIDGYIPYRDIFDHKGPIVYLIHALGYAIYPMSGIWLLYVLMLFFAFVLLFEIARKYLNDLTTIMTISALFLTVPIYDAWDNTEGLAQLPLAFCITTISFYIKNNTITKKWCFFYGIASALLILMKPIYLTAPLIFGTYIALDLLYQQNYAKLKLFCINTLCGFFLTVTSILFWLWINNALVFFYQDYILFNLLYAKKYTTGNTFLNTLKFFCTQREIIAAWIAIGFSILNFNHFDTHKKKLFILFTLTFITNLMVLTLPKNTHHNYLLVLYPIIFILLILALSQIKQKITTSIILCILSIALAHQFYNDITEKHSRYNIESLQYKRRGSIISQYLAKKENFSSLVWEDTGCLLFLYSNHNSATLYPMHYVSLKIIPQEVWKDFEQKKPHTVVTTEKYSNKIKGYGYSLIYHGNNIYIYQKN